VIVAIDHRVVPPRHRQFGPEDGGDGAASSKDRSDLVILSVSGEREVVVGWPILLQEKAFHSRTNLGVVEEPDLRKVVE
jgi:hypothetical protein